MGSHGAEHGNLLVERAAAVMGKLAEWVVQSRLEDYAWGLLGGSAG